MKTSGKFKIFAIKSLVVIAFLILFSLLIFWHGENMNDFLSENKYFFLVWRIFLYSLLSYFWLKAIKQKILNASNKNPIKRIEILLIFFFILIEFIILY